MKDLSRKDTTCRFRSITPIRCTQLSRVRTAGVTLLVSGHWSEIFVNQLRRRHAVYA
jgi:hypothetical protein